MGEHADHLGTFRPAVGVEACAGRVRSIRAGIHGLAWPRAMDLEKEFFRRTAPAYLELFQQCKCQHKYTETDAQSEQP